MKNNRLIAPIALLSLTGVTVLAVSPPVSAGPVITDVNTDKARYTPGTPVSIYVSVKNTTGTAISNGKVTLYCKYLGNIVATLPVRTINLARNASATLTFTWTPPGTDFQGYSVEAWARNATGGLLDNLNTAVDVSSNWTRFPRYGYVSGYPSQTYATSTNQIWQMKNYHINAVQFYDWQYKHHLPLAGTVANPAASWTELGNRTNYRQTILDMIDAGHGYNMSAMNYNLIYGAMGGYSGEGVDHRWGLWFSPNGTDQYTLDMPSNWVSDLYMFNPGDPGWQNYLINREADVFAAYPFDGWQIDSIGNPPGTVYAYGSDAQPGTPVDLWSTFRPFINNAKTRLNKTIIFNNVGGYGLYDTAANSAEDVVYVECWPGTGQNTYNDLKGMIDNSIAWSGGKGVVIPAYMNYEHAKSFSAGAPGSFNPASVLLTNATIFASGATHLELGDGSYMLCSEYFPNRNLVPSTALKATLRNYYDFLVAYENLLQGRFNNSGNAITLNVPASNNAAPNTVWTFAKVNGSGAQHMLNLINLMGESSNNWRDDYANYPVPTLQTNLSVKYYHGAGTVQSVQWATPDSENGKMNTLPFTPGSDGGGGYIQFTVPRLAYWDMIYIKK